MSFSSSISCKILTLTGLRVARRGLGVPARAVSASVTGRHAAPGPFLCSAAAVLRATAPAHPVSPFSIN